MQFKTNLNHDVKVKLNSLGVDILKKHYNVKDISELDFAKMDAEGYTKFQLWSLMAIYGEYIYMGDKVPFDTNIIILNGKVLEE